jgi:hypothetical protein
MPEFKVGQVVYAEGASAILGDVVAVDDEGVTVAWRPTTTCEQPDDLVHLVPGELNLRREQTPMDEAIDRFNKLGD